MGIQSFWHIHLIRRDSFLTIQLGWKETTSMSYSLNMILVSLLILLILMCTRTHQMVWILLMKSSWRRIKLVYKTRKGLRDMVLRFHGLEDLTTFLPNRQGINQPPLR